jgi:hypothetical protein
MALAYIAALRNAQLDRITTQQDAGAGASLLRIYDGTRPATGGTVTNLLAQLTFTDPSYPAASGGVLTASAITQDSSADATGTAPWFRVVDSALAFVMDGSVGTSGSDLNLNSVSITSGGTVAVTSWVVTAGNA